MQALKMAHEKRNTKINKIEKLKVTKNPDEAYKKIKEYAKNGYDSILSEDKSYFLKCFGIFDKPATPNEFMMRIRIPGGQLSFEQAVALGEVSRDFGANYMDLTTRAQVELRYISIQNMPKVLDKLQSVGITPYQTGVDNFRGLVADPLDFQAFDNIISSQETLLKIQEKFLYNQDWISAIPRKFNASITGSISNRCNAFGHDCCFVLAQKDGIYGYNMYLGGKVGKIAQNADVFLKNEEEVIMAFEAIITLFKTYGFRDNRNKNRLFFLIESVGIQEISKAIREYAKADFATSGTTLTKMDNEDGDQGKSILKDGAFALHVVVLAGVFSGSDLVDAALLAKKYGSGDIRLDVEQNIYLMNIKQTQEILKEEFFKRYKNLGSPYANHLIACAGQKHCQFGVIPNKPDSIDLAKYLEQKVPLSSDGKVRMYWSGCVKGCGLHDLGDIGFEGCKTKVDGTSEYGVHIFLGGRTTRDAQMGYSVLKSVPLRFAKYHIESLMLEYRRLRGKDESFESFNTRVLKQYSRGAVGFMMMLMAYIRMNELDIEIGFKENIKTGKNENFEIFEIGRVLYKAVMKYEAYELIDTFTPIFPRKLGKINYKKENFDENFAMMINNMLKEEKKAVVFSELNHFVQMV